MGDTSERPRHTCDIVMKGGITSGVVYPRAIAVLAERYDFKNIGGTSAGAIAAATAAAAEYRRQSHDGDFTGYTMLSQLPEWLGKSTGRQTNLLSLFQPNARTRRLFAVLLSALGDGCKVKRVSGQALLQYPGWALLGALIGLIFRLALGGFSIPSQHIIVVMLWIITHVVLLALGAAAAIVARFVFEFIREVPRSNFGLCSGMPDGDGVQPGHPLTSWLSRYLNEVAGLDPEGDPLTFGHLRGTGAEACVNLEMMTTNLTHGRPYRLPFRDDDDLHENHLFFFNKEEFTQLFPARVVAWMIDHPRQAVNSKDDIVLCARLREQGYYPMPAPADLPVVVATRMSLSFPLLLCAVPLYGIDYSLEQLHTDTKYQIERCWFSDGGLCSNFPLHFFDAPLPRRPTFSIDLTTAHPDTPPEKLIAVMDTDNNPNLVDRWNRIDTAMPRFAGETPAVKSDGQRLLSFFGALLTTMQNWPDATQSRLPGYRDRIVRVPLRPEEGGLNLNMPDDRITALMERGVDAAELLMRHFDNPSAEKVMTWDNHRWIRLRTFLASHEKLLDQLVTACDHPENEDCCYETWLQRLLTAEDGEKCPSYAMTNKQLTAAIATLSQLRTLRQSWQPVTAADKAPRPRAILRPRPQM